MTFGQIENFIAVVDAGSFSAAAEKRYISPQALIQQIAKMEQELGFRLLMRSSKGVRLTAAGEEYYRGVSSILSQYKSCVERAAKIDKKASVLRIGLPDNVNSTFMLSICKSFSEKYPDIRMRFENYSVQDSVKAITQGKIDVCAQIKPEEETPYFCQQLLPVPHFCLVTSSSPLVNKRSVCLEDLAGYTIGVWGSLSVYRNLSAYVADHGLDIRLRSLPENYSEALIFCVQGNVLLTCAPVIDTLKGSLEVIPVNFDFGLHYYIACSDADNETVQKFLTVANETASSETHPWKQTLSSYSNK